MKRNASAKAGGLGRGAGSQRHPPQESGKPFRFAHLAGVVAHRHDLVVHRLADVDPALGVLARNAQPPPFVERVTVSPGRAEIRFQGRIQLQHVLAIAHYRGFLAFLVLMSGVGADSSIRVCDCSDIAC